MVPLLGGPNKHPEFGFNPGECQVPVFNQVIDPVFRDAMDVSFASPDCFIESVGVTSIQDWYDLGSITVNKLLNQLFKPVNSSI